MIPRNATKLWHQKSEQEYSFRCDNCGGWPRTENSGHALRRVRRVNEHRNHACFHHGQHDDVCFDRHRHREQYTVAGTKTVGSQLRNNIVYLPIQLVESDRAPSVSNTANQCLPGRTLPQGLLEKFERVQLHSSFANSE